MSRPGRRHVTVSRTALVAAALAAVTLAGCGGDGENGTSADPASTPSSASSPASSSPAAGTFNEADVEFAQNMIVHHEQAVEMADEAATKASNPQVKELAGKIKAAQAPEIATMTAWLTSWGKPTAPPAGHGGHDMPGMMTDADMTKLEAATGAEFDRMFLQMMIKHHEGAVEMARTEQADGASTEAMDLAATIDKTQTAQIATMRKLLG